MVIKGRLEGEKTCSEKNKDNVAWEEFFSSRRIGWGKIFL